MTTTLEERVREALAWRADHTTMSPNATFKNRPFAADLAVGGRRRSWRVPVTAAAALLVVVGGFAIATLRDNPSTDRTSNPTVPAAGSAVGIFPTGDAAAVVAAGYDSPQAAVQAYLADRAQTSQVPFGTVVTATVHDVRIVDDDRAVVYFGLDTAGDSSDGHAEAVRVTSADGSTGWAVTRAFVVSLEVPSMSFDGDELTGSFAGGPYDAVLSISDAASGEPLWSDALPFPPANGPSARPPGTPVDVNDLPVSAAIVQVWQTDPDADRAAPVFGEFLIRDGEQLVTGSRVVSADYYPDFPMFADAAVSALDALGNGETLVVADGDVTITASHDVGGNTYCVEVIGGAEQQRDCWPLAMIAAGDARQFVGRVLYRIVPDGVTVTRDGEPVTVTDNVWYTMTAEDGSTPRFEFTDGVVTQVEGGPPSPPPDAVASVPPSSGLSAAPAAVTGNPYAPTLFPVVETDAPVAASFGTASGGEPFTEVAFGRIEDGSVLDAVVFNIGPAEVIGPSDRSGIPVSVFGQPATLVEGTGVGVSQVVVWGDDPVFVAVGADPMAFLDAIEADTIEVSLPASSAPALTIGDLPGGYEVLVEPQPVGAPGSLNGILQIGDNEVVTSARNFLASMVLAGNVTQIDIDGTVGWTFPDGTNTHDIAWQVDDNTFAYLKNNDGSSVDDALAIARSVEFVPVGEWMTRYNVGLPPSAPPTTIGSYGSGT